METIFLNAAGVVLFVRNDIEQGTWTQEEYTVNMTFPFVSGKVIQHGQRVAFRDPATNTLEMFEIRNVQTIEPDHYQQIIAEHIAVSELSDEHINTTEITDKTAAQTLTTALTGTSWGVGNDTSSGAVSSVDISRGSVWQAVCSIMQNWNVYITPRVTVDSSGNITGKYLDISPAQGTWRGVRLSIDKNMIDASVTYDDSEVYTALYGYGGNVDKPQQTGDDKTEELTFADVVWTATSAHPAKPAGQTFLEDPEKTALYGRNGRPRFGYYQNSNIKDAEVLLEKTWESLKQSSEPKISITGTVADLYRLGYTDEPLRLHDTVIVEIRQTGEVFEKEITKLNVDLIDPTRTSPDIGSYIPNIIYINRETNKEAGGGGGGGRSVDSETNQYNTFSTLEKNTDKYGSMIGMVVGTRNGDDYVKGGEIVLAINDDHGTTATIQADVIDIQGLVDELTAYDVTVETLTTYNTITAHGDATFLSGITVEGDVNGITNLDADYASFSTLTVDGKEYEYKYKTVVTNVGVTLPTVTRSTARYFMYAASSGSTTPSSTQTGRLVTGYTEGIVLPTTATIYYLGRDS